MQTNTKPPTFIEASAYTFMSMGLRRKPADRNYSVQVEKSSSSSNTIFVVFGVLFLLLVGFIVLVGPVYHHAQLKVLKSYASFSHGKGDSKDSILFHFGGRPLYLGGRFITEDEIGDCKGVIVIQKTSEELLRIMTFADYKSQPTSSFGQLSQKIENYFRPISKARDPKSLFYFSLPKSNWDEISDKAKDDVVFFKFGWGLKQFPPDGLNVSQYLQECD